MVRRFAGSPVAVTKTRSESGYDRLADLYRWIERPVFGDDLMIARSALIDKLPPCQTIALFGDGDGRLLAKIVQSQPNAKITSFDQSSKMIEKQQRNASRVASAVSPDASLDFVHADLKDAELPLHQFDVLVVPFFLDCFTKAELNAHLDRWLSAIRPGGTLYYVDFVIPQNRLLKYYAKFWLSIMHWFFRMQTGLQQDHLLDHGAWLRARGLKLVHERLTYHQMIATRIYERRR